MYKIKIDLWEYIRFPLPPFPSLSTSIFLMIEKQFLFKSTNNKSWFLNLIDFLRSLSLFFTQLSHFRVFSFLSICFSVFFCSSLVRFVLFYYNYILLCVVFTQSRVPPKSRNSWPTLWLFYCRCCSSTVYYVHFLR